MVCDTDVLIQLFLTNQPPILRVLQHRYGVRCVIVPEVESEARWSKRFGARFEQALDKALRTGTLSVLDQSSIGLLLPGTTLPAATLGGVIQAIQTVGASYNLKVDRGEAYTYAAALAIGVPAASNDNNALSTLEKAGLGVPSPTLRFFDLIAFGVQSGLLKASDADVVRKSLVSAGEHVPKAFKNVSFSVGISSFCPRLVDGSKSTIGLPAATGSGRRQQLTLLPLP